MIILVLGLSIGLLSGCDELEDILTQLFSDENNNDGVENIVENEVENNNDNLVENNNNDNDNDTDISEPINDNSDLFFDEKLIADGYSLTTLPNGFPITIPYHWLLVDNNMNDPDRTGFNGLFCYNLPLEPHAVANILESLNEIYFEHYDGEGDVLFSVEFSDEEFTGATGTFEFIVDEFDNSCVELTFSFMDDEMQEGYDSEQIEVHSFTDTNSYIVEDRERSVPSDYKDEFDEYLELTRDTPDMGFDSDDIESIEEKLANQDYEMEHISSGYPRIFPYEWYSMKFEQADAGWSGTFCTDLSTTDSILKFHSLLEAHNADILDYETNGSPSMNSKSKVDFAFNDEHYTGSWKGHANFHIDRLNEFQTHKCVIVNMEFSPDRLD